MAKVKTKADEYKEIFIKLHRYQRKGADNLILLLTRFVRAKAEYMTQYIDIVAERSGVSPTGHITTTNADIMLPVVPCYCGDRARLGMRERVAQGMGGVH